MKRLPLVRESPALKPRSADCPPAVTLPVRFQNGLIRSRRQWDQQPSLVCHRRRSVARFQSGQFACRENAVALTKIQEAMMWLQKRTLDRLRPWVEGTNQK